VCREEEHEFEEKITLLVNLGYQGLEIENTMKVIHEKNLRIVSFQNNKRRKS